MRALAFSLGLTVLGIGLSSMIGYVLGESHLYNWDGNAGMAVNTAVAFIMTGVSLCIVSSRAACFYLKDKA